MTVAERLQHGRDRLLAHGLTKHCLIDPETGALCALGAVLDISWVRRWEETQDATSARTLRRALALLDWAVAPHDAKTVTVGTFDSVGNEIVTFNNRPETTLNDVLDVFDAAISKAKEQDW